MRKKTKRIVIVSILAVVAILLMKAPEWYRAYSEQLNAADEQSSEYEAPANTEATSTQAGEVAPTASSSESGNDTQAFTNNTKKDLMKKTDTDDGLVVEIIAEGEGPAIQEGQTAVVHYTGRFPDGTTFDSSIQRGTPFEFTLGAGQVIRGWDEGVRGMKVGERRRLTVPPELAYGERGAGGVIPPNATLVFEIELIGIK